MSGAAAPSASPHLFGQSAAENVLMRAWRSGRLPHAWLFTGPRGVGKATLAFRFARALLAGPAEAVACQEPSHPIFRMVANGAHPDLRVLVIPTDPKTGRRKTEIPVDLVRDAAEALRVTASRGGARVLLVDAADDLNRNAANALLKLLEEPPPGVLLLLIGQRPGLLPQTIPSRCALLRLHPLDEPAMRQGLAALAPDTAPDLLEQALAGAEGSLGRAMVLLQGDWLKSYAVLLDSLARGREALGPRLEAAELLSRWAQRQAQAEPGSGVTAAAGLLGMVLRRAAHAAAGRPPAAELVPGEGARLAALAPVLGLDRSVALWDKLHALAGRVEGLNLDPLQAFLQIVQDVTDGRPTSPEPIAG
ncbi:DNA polymerase III subunit delta' [Geminicoccaceae bacterium 1502E]|nr:DNA polymerase III subunit delta' [Geminicoccaceae bacterium 1502E]